MILYFIKKINCFSFYYIVNKPAWDQLIGLYPYLVDCTTTTSPEVSRSLREALLQYTDLLHAPKCFSNNSNDNTTMTTISQNSTTSNETTHQQQTANGQE